MKRNNLYFEALFIGIVVGLIGTPISYLAMKMERKNVNLPMYSWVRIFFTFVVTGIVAHLLFEYTGLNKKYCKSGHACSKN